MARDNKLLGQFDLIGIPPAPRGMPQIEVTFDIDANGIVNVSAKDKATGKEQNIRIQASGGLKDDDIEKMIKEAEQHAEEDKKIKEAIEARNHADAMIHETEKQLKEHGDKIGSSEKEGIEKAVQELKDVLDSNDADRIKEKTNALTQASLKLGEAMYKASQAQSAEAGQSETSEPDSKADDTVVDADFEEVKK